VPGARGYTITRYKADDPQCCRVETALQPYLDWHDKGPGNTGLQWSGTYVYVVTAYQPNSTYGATSVSWQRPEPANPVGFTAKQTGEGTVELSWQPVSGASAYWLFGSGANGSEGIRIEGTSKVVAQVPAGRQEWRLTTVYDPAGFLLPASGWPVATVDVRRYSGKYRIVLNAATVNNPTSDDLLNRDGWGDEVVFFGMVQVLDRGGYRPNTETRKIRTPTPKQFSEFGRQYGDTAGSNAPRFKLRTSAGTLTPTGGIGKGDVIPSGATPGAPYGTPVSDGLMPMLLFEDSLTDGREVLFVHPGVAEVDGGYSAISSYEMVTFSSCYAETLLNSAEVRGQMASTTIGPAIVEPARAEYLGCTAPYEVELSQLGDEDRVIGLVKPKDPAKAIPTDYYVVLTREKIENALGSNSYTALKVDRIDRFDGGNGNYSLWILIQRL
jgi:hypothetical protein